MVSGRLPITGYTLRKRQFWSELYDHRKFLGSDSSGAINSGPYCSNMFRRHIAVVTAVAKNHVYYIGSTSSLRYHNFPTLVLENVNTLLLIVMICEQRMSVPSPATSSWTKYHKRPFSQLWDHRHCLSKSGEFTRPKPTPHEKFPSLWVRPNTRWSGRSGISLITLTTTQTPNLTLY